MRNVRSIFLGWLLCGIATNLLSQNIHVYSGKNLMDSSTWVRIEIPANQPYKRYGEAILPTIGIECHQSGEKHDFQILLHTGLVETEGWRVLGSAELEFRHRLDDAEPGRSIWAPLTDGETYACLGGWKPQMPRELFLKDLFSAKRLLVEFQPYRWNGNFTAEFDMQGLAGEFARHEECKLN
jgi:hypothetical protein